MQLDIKPIGIVESSRTVVTDDYWGDVTAVIHLDDKIFKPDATLNLDSFSHIEVIFYMDQVDPTKITFSARHPRNDPKLPLVGILAQRTKNRFNRLGLSRAKIVNVDRLDITVSGLDAVDGTPILDIKPYTLGFVPDNHDVKEPAWMAKIMQNYYAKRG